MNKKTRGYGESAKDTAIVKHAAYNDVARGARSWNRNCAGWTETDRRQAAGNTKAFSASQKRHKYNEG
jgi:hypothetical protein